MPCTDSVRRAERFIEENAVKAIGLADVASGPGRQRKGAAAGPGAERARPSRPGRRLGRFGRVCARVRVSQPVCGRLQGPLPRAAFRNIAPRHGRTLSYWVTATFTVAIGNVRSTSTPAVRGAKTLWWCRFGLTHYLVLASWKSATSHSWSSIRFSKPESHSVGRRDAG